MKTLHINEIPVIKWMIEKEISLTELLKNNVIQFLEKFKPEDLQLINRMDWKDLDMIRMLTSRRHHNN